MADRLAEIVAALSLATDLGTGHPFERSLRSCVLAVEFGRSIGLAVEDLQEIYYLALLRWTGCTADSHRADLFGDEIALGPAIDAVELWNSGAMLAFLWRHIGAGEPPLTRARHLGVALATGVQRSRVAAVAHCEVAQQISDRLDLGPAIRQSLGQIFERWDGGGVPGAVKGDQLRLAVRIVHLAMDAELYHRAGGMEGAIAVMSQRAGGFYDPDLAAAFSGSLPRLWRHLDAESVWDTALAAEPGERRTMTADGLDAALGAIADFTDLRSPHTAGHSRSVADLAENAARHAGLPADDALLAHRAGLVHDLGMAGLSITLVERAGPLTSPEWERVRLHPYYTERILARVPGLASVAAVAALHHERLDGSGYHRGLPKSLLPPAARIVAVADGYQSMTEARSYRPARTAADAAGVLRDEARSGRFDGDAVTAVLRAAGHRVPPKRRDGVAGLTDREIEVLRHLAHGQSKRQVAEALTVSVPTVDHHVRHIYEKIGVSTRAGAVMFAMRHHLIDPVDD